MQPVHRSQDFHGSKPPTKLDRRRLTFMPVTAAELTELLTGSSLVPEHVEVVDTSDGCGSKFEAIVVSAAFDGMGLLDRQRAVNDVIAEPMKAIHAFSMKTWTPKQYEAKQQTSS